MSGMYDQIKALQHREAEHNAWRDTMVQHLAHEREENNRLRLENDALRGESKMLKELLGSYATEVIRK